MYFFTKKLGIILVSMTIIIVVVKIFYVITLTDPNSESRVKLLMSLNIYVPRDERFGHLKMSDFLAYQLKSIAQFLKPELESIFDSTPNEFDSFQDVLKLYEGGFKLPHGLLETIRDNIPAEMLKQIFPTDGEGLLKYPMPQVIKGIISFSDTIIS
jgi:linoleate 9S-lipoxygenase